MLLKVKTIRRAVTLSYLLRRHEMLNEKENFILYIGFIVYIVVKIHTFINRVLYYILLHISTVNNYFQSIFIINKSCIYIINFIRLEHKPV